MCRQLQIWSYHNYISMRRLIISQALIITMSIISLDFQYWMNLFILNLYKFLIILCWSSLSRCSAWRCYSWLSNSNISIVQLPRPSPPLITIRTNCSNFIFLQTGRLTSVQISPDQLLMLCSVFRFKWRFSYLTTFYFLGSSFCSDLILSINQIHKIKIQYLKTSEI